MNTQTIIGTLDSERIFNEKTARSIVNLILEEYKPVRGFYIYVSSWWGAGQRWARNTPSLTSDRRQVVVQIVDTRMRPSSNARTNQLDPTSVKATADIVKYYATKHDWNKPLDRVVDPIVWSPEGSIVWSDDTYRMALEETAKVVKGLVKSSENEKLMSAGFIEATGAAALKFERDPWGKESYKWGSTTQARCAATVRHPKGTGSGWAGKTSFDINRLDFKAVADIAFEKCMNSIDPVRIEPGRYQSILEADAVATLARLLVSSLIRLNPERGADVPTILGADPSLQRFRSKLGLKLLDPRITIYHDPKDPLMGTHVSDSVDKVTLIDKGVLVNLYTPLEYHLNELVDLNVPISRSSFAISGGSTTTEEMISSTERGLLVTRLSQPQGVHGPSLLFTGVTRDGVWLIEKGKISKAVRNLRWTESPMFAFNNLEQLGIQEPVFAPVESRSPLERGFHNSLTNILVPTMKINDFSYTSTIDAI